MPANLTLYTRALDFGLNALDTECDAIHICVTGIITDYASVLSLSRGSKTFTRGQAFGSPSDGSGGGRIVASAALTGGTVSADGDVTQWAAVDSTTTRVLAAGSLSSTVSVVNGQSFSLNSYNVHVYGTAASTYSGIGDIAGLPAPACFYSLRALSAAKIGSNIVQMRYNNANPVTYAAQSNGGLPMAQISADQSSYGSPTTIGIMLNQGTCGSAADISRDVAGNDSGPKFQLNGYQSTFPVIRRDNAATQALASNGDGDSGAIGGGPYNQPWSFYCVAKATANGGLISIGTAGVGCALNNAATNWWSLDANGDRGAAAAINHWHCDVAIANGNSSKHYLDGSDTGSGNAGSTAINASHPFNMGFNQYGNQVTADYLEFGFWAGDISAYATAIYNNMINYYGALA